jgi:YbbR domain-containing protein
MAWHPFRNPGLKTLALVLGTLLWFTISGYQIERRISVPVSYRNMPASLVMTEEPSDRVTVYVRGDDNVVSALTEGAVRVVVDLQGGQPGLNPLPIRTDQVVAPARVEVVQVDPGTVTVVLERAGQTSVRVKPTVEGRPAAGFAVGSITVEPDRVVVTGPASRLLDPIDVITEKVMIEGRNSRVVQEVGVGVSNPQVRVQSPRTVRVSVQINAVTPEATGGAGAQPHPAAPPPGER